MNYAKIGKYVLYALGICLVLLVCWGAYKFYFMKPVPNTQTITVMPGATANIKQVEELKKAQHLITGLYLGKSGDATEYGVEVSWLW
jgi:hypothetical protein